MLYFYLSFHSESNQLERRELQAHNSINISNSNVNLALWIELFTVASTQTGVRLCNDGRGERRPRGGVAVAQAAAVGGSRSSSPPPPSWPLGTMVVRGARRSPSCVARMPGKDNNLIMFMQTWWFILVLYLPPPNLIAPNDRPPVLLTSRTSSNLPTTSRACVFGWLLCLNYQSAAIRQTRFFRLFYCFERSGTSENFSTKSGFFISHEQKPR